MDWYRRLGKAQQARSVLASKSLYIYAVYGRSRQQWPPTSAASVQAAGKEAFGVNGCTNASWPLLPSLDPLGHRCQPALNANFWIQSQRFLIDLKCFRDLGLATPVAPFVSWKDPER